MLVLNDTIPIVEDTAHKSGWPAAKLWAAGAALVA